MRVVVPELLAARRIDRVNDTQSLLVIEHTADLDRLGGRVAGRQIDIPGEAETADIAAVDLGQRAEMLFAVSAPEARPIGATCRIDILQLRAGSRAANAAQSQKATHHRQC